MYQLSEPIVLLFHQHLYLLSPYPPDVTTWKRNFLTSYHPHMQGLRKTYWIQLLEQVYDRAKESLPSDGHTPLHGDAQGEQNRGHPTFVTDTNTRI